VEIEDEHGGMEALGHRGLEIWPNPARDWIMLTLPENVSAAVLDLAINNLFGQEVMKSSFIPQNRVTSLNISNLPAGFYLAVCKDSKRKIYKGKFVIAR